MNPFLESIDDLSRLRQLVWDELALAAEEQDRPWGLGVVGTVSDRGPELRTMVLRGVDVAQNEVTWYTDRRSGKFQQINTDPRTAVVFWNPQLRVQLTVRGTSSLHTAGPVFDRHWEQTSLTSRRSYLGNLFPGEKVPLPCVNFPLELTTRPPTHEESLLGMKNFVVVSTIVHELDLLILRQSGNVRACFHWTVEDQDSPRWNDIWVCP